MSSRILVAKTASGSVYHVDKVARTVHRVSGGAHYAGRAVGDAAEYTDLRVFEIGKPMVIFWGYGRDEFSPDDGLPDEPRERITTTSPVTSIEPLSDCVA